MPDQKTRQQIISHRDDEKEEDLIGLGIELDSDDDLPKYKPPEYTEGNIETVSIKSKNKGKFSSGRELIN